MGILSPLEPARIWLERLDVQFLEERPEHDSHAYDLSIEPRVWKDISGLSYKVRLDLTFAPRDDSLCSYARIQVTAVGIFNLAAETSDELRRQLIPLNCYVVLYGFSRGIVAQVTGLNPGGPFLLPAVNYIEVLRSKRRVSARAPRKQARRAR